MRWIAMAAWLTGCYSPKFGDCALACGAGDSCPPGLTCSNAVCRVPGAVGTACNDVVDASVPTADVNPDDCTWTLVSTNFGEVDVPATSPPPWDVTEDQVFTTGDVGGHAVSQSDAGSLWIVHHSRFTVAEGVTLTLEGTHPLVIAADEMDIRGTIVVNNGRGHTTCDAAPGADICQAGAGGGGAGYGGVGGDGGGPPPDTGGQQDGVLPTPLRGGCPGAKGGDGRNPGGDLDPQPGGAGGIAGGALQLSARLSINVSGSILANGGGGQNGISDAANQFGCQPGTSLGRAAGGGGGGGGGTIFIESCATVIQPTAKLCANGGAGGGGSGGGDEATPRPGQNGSCDAVATGGIGEIANSFGGNGGYDGIPATPGAVAARGGGGGGGAVGRIHIQQIAGSPVTVGATIRPAANRSQ